MDADFVTVPISQYVSLQIETFVFGVFVVLYGIAVWILLYRWDNMKQDKVLFIVSTLMLVIALAHLVIDLLRGLEGFVYHNHNKESSTRFFWNGHNTTSILKSVLYVTQTTVGDSYMAYRVFILWRRRWIVPSLVILLLIVTAATGYVSCYDLTKLIKPQGLTAQRSPWLITFFALATAYNLFSMGAVFLCIYLSKRRMRRLSTLPGTLSGRRVLATFLQSSAIYTVVLVALFVTYIIDVNPEMFGTDILTPIIGVAFTLIIIRVELGNTVLIPPTNKPRIVWWKRKTPPRLADGTAPSRVRKPAPIYDATPKSSGILSPDHAASDYEDARALLYAAEKAINRSQQLMDARGESEEGTFSVRTEQRTCVL